MKNKYFAFVILILVIEIICTCNAKDKIEKRTGNVNASVVEDGKITAPQIIKKYGYPFKKYSVTTEDGYILSLFRIPKPGGMPVLLVHGFTGSSATFVMMGPKKGLAFRLSRAGYDVWLFNARGTTYSRDHVDTVTISDDDYWDFSWHSIGIYDLPAVIDAIVGKTNFMKIFYVGFSQGATVFWVMCSERSSYANKIELMQAISPTAYLGNTISPLLRYASRVDWMLDQLGFVGINQLNISEAIEKKFDILSCSNMAKINVFCRLPIFLITGVDYTEIDLVAKPAIIGHGDQGASVKQFQHFVQLIKSSNFTQFDYGIGKNQKTYGQKNPPPYKLENVNCKVVLHYGPNDWFAPALDVDHLATQLPNIIERRFLNLPSWNHMDFVTSKNVNRYINKPLINLFNKHKLNITKKNK